MVTIKKYFFALLFVVLFSLSTSRTLVAQNTISVGPKVGLNLANFIGEDVKDYKNRTGFNVGILISSNITESFVFSNELEYSSQGAKLYLNNLETTIKLNYLRSSMLLNYYFGDSEMDLRSRLFLGVYCSSLSKPKSKTGDGNYNDIVDGTFVIGDMDCGVAFGAGLDFRMIDDIWLTSYVCYNWGITDIYHKSHFSAYNSVLSVNLGVTFPLSFH